MYKRKMVFLERGVESMKIETKKIKKWISIVLIALFVCLFSLSLSYPTYIHAIGGSFWNGAPVITEAFSETKWTQNNVKIIVSATSPNGSITSIELPDGTIVSGNTVEYVVSDNGVYPFVVYDSTGDMTGKFIEVKNIDRSNPSADVTVPSNWEKNDVDVNVTGRP